MSQPHRIAFEQASRTHVYCDTYGHLTIIDPHPHSGDEHTITIGPCTCRHASTPQGGEAHGTQEQTPEGESSGSDSD